MPGRFLLVRLVALLLVAVPGSGEADELRGTGAIFTARGLALLWGIVRGPDETRTLVVLRIERLDGRAPWRFANVEALDPLSGRQDLLRLALSLDVGPGVTVEMSREGFVAQPHRRILLYRDAEALQDGRPGLVVSYSGIPDGIPEFGSPADLAEYFRHARERLH